LIPFCTKFLCISLRPSVTEQVRRPSTCMFVKIFVRHHQASHELVRLCAVFVVVRLSRSTDFLTLKSVLNLYVARHRAVACINVLPIPSAFMSVTLSCCI